MQNLEPLMDGKQKAVRLFIADLPETTDAMIPGGVYAMIAETPPARFPVVATSMAGVMAAGLPATLLVPSSPKVFVERLSQVGFPGIDDAMDSGRVQVFQFQDDFSKKMFRFGAEAFLNELDHFRLPAQSYLVIDQADELLSLHDISLALEQAEALGSWARKLKVTVLLVFTRLAAVPSSVATLTGLMDYLSGIVRLGGHQDGLDLVFEYWQSPDGTVAAKAFGLAIQDTGVYRVKPRETVVLPEEVSTDAAVAVRPEPEPEEEPGDLLYLYIDSQLAAVGQQVPGIWKACDSVVGLIRAAFGTRAPCVLLVYERQTQLRDLSEAVHTLRLSLGRRARIVVIERDASLRYQNEILLLRLGTSLVVHRDVPENRIPLMLESIRGQVFNREVEMDFEAALSSVVTSAKRGYLPPATFAREITAIVDRAEMLNLPCALVIASPAGAKACTEVLTQVRVHRAGDMSTTDGEYCYLFFSGCPQSSVAKALQTVTAERDLFAMQDIHVNRNDIRRQLTALSESTHGKQFPDTLVEYQPPVQPVRLEEPLAPVALPAVATHVESEPAPEPPVTATLDVVAEDAINAVADDLAEAEADTVATTTEVEVAREVQTPVAVPQAETVAVPVQHDTWHVEPTVLSRAIPTPKPLRRAVRRYASPAAVSDQGEPRE